MSTPFLDGVFTEPKDSENSLPPVDLKEVKLTKVDEVFEEEEFRLLFDFVPREETEVLLIPLPEAVGVEDA